MENGVSVSLGRERRSPGSVWSSSATSCSQVWGVPPEEVVFRETIRPGRMWIPHPCPQDNHRHFQSERSGERYHGNASQVKMEKGTISSSNRTLGLSDWSFIDRISADTHACCDNIKSVLCCLFCPGEDWMCWPMSFARNSTRSSASLTPSLKLQMRFETEAPCILVAMIEKLHF